jgi:hypothetical protein
VSRLSSLERFAIPDRIIVPIVFVVACVLVYSRRPDSVLHAQFFAEDGSSWYANAHDIGIRSLLIPYRDYLVIVQRLAGCLSLLVPLRYAPLVMNLIAIGIQALPAAFLASSRLVLAIRRSWLQLALGLLYVGLPNIWGTMTTVTNAQWHLAVLACIVVLSTPSRHAAWRVFDVLVVSLSALSGPFAIFLVPVLALKWYFRRERWLLVLGGIAVVAGLVQTSLIFFAHNQNAVRPPLGGLNALLRVLVGRVFYGFLFGQTGYNRLVNDSSTIWLELIVIRVVAVALVVLLGYVLVRGSLELRLLLVFGGLALAAALLWPTFEPLQVPYWKNLQSPGASNRYFLIPMFALGCAFVWLAAQRAIAARIIAGIVLSTALIFGVTRDWREPPPLDYDFPRFVAKYNRAPSGAKIQILYPPGWSMVLTKP